jgi:hypothetical protein
MKMNAVIDQDKIRSVAQSGPVAPWRLEFVRGASNVTIAGDPSLTDLYSAHFAGPTPDVQRVASDVLIEYPRFMLFGWTRAQARIGLNPLAPWRIEIRRGVSRLVADLRKLDLLGFEVVGGISQAELRLPQPRGTVSIRISGGVSGFRLHRPAGVAARIQIGGGASKLGLDRQYLGAIGGPIQLETPDYATAADRYELDIRGGASRVTVDQEG